MKKSEIIPVSEMKQEVELALDFSVKWVSFHQLSRDVLGLPFGAYINLRNNGGTFSQKFCS